MVRIAMIIAPSDFRDEEYEVPKQTFESEDIEVNTFTKGVYEARGALGSVVHVDGMLEPSFSPEVFDAVVFVGGAGARVYFNDTQVLDIVRNAFNQGKIVAAICIAPSILANAGVLQGKKATSYTSEQSNLEERGAIVVQKDVVVDGLIVTANGPSAAGVFAKEIIALCKKKS
jgi:protease I